MTGPPPFKRAIVPQVKYYPLGDVKPSEDSIAIPIGVNCAACKTYHPPGQCPIKLAGVEYCNLCGMAHYGSARVCPHIQSETQVRQMLEALKQSNEPEHLVTEARRYLRGLKGNLVQLKKQTEAKKFAAREAEKEAVFQKARAPLATWRMT